MEVTLPPSTTLAARPPLPIPQCKAALQQTPAELEHADFLAVDDLLDFSNEDIGGPIEPSVSNASSCEVTVEPSASVSFDGKLSSQACEFDSLGAPCDDLAELEWLSNFVEECFSSCDAPACCLGNLATYIDLGDNAAPAHRRISTSSGSDESFRTTSPVSVLETNAFSAEKHCPQTFSFSPDLFVPGRARSKRCRTAVGFWNTRILCPEVSESLLETTSTTYPTRAGSSESIMYNSYYDDEDDDEDEAHADVNLDNVAPFARLSPNRIVKNASMKLKKSCYSNSKSSINHPSRKSKKMKVDNQTSLRKCLHCATQKTPQWRAGPMGPKTLCNACGVRYKSGRLCEEYRPAASPTFIERVHSNSHRKVLEMRRQRCEIGSGHEGRKHNSSSLNWRASEVSLGCAVAATDDDDGRQYPASAVTAEDTNGQ